MRRAMNKTITVYIFFDFMPKSKEKDEKRQIKEKQNPNVLKSICHSIIIL